MTWLIGGGRVTTQGPGQQQGIKQPGLRSTLTVAIIEDQPETRRGLEVLINGTPGYRCTGTFGSMEEAVRKLTPPGPCVALVDIGLPGMSGIDGIPLLRERCPETTVLVLTVYKDDDRIFGAMCAGAFGYLLKKTPPGTLLESLKEAADGGAPMSPEVARRVISLFHRVRPPQKADHDLTPHEVRLLQLLAEGHNRKTAAGKLGVSPNTVAFHMRRIYEKLHVHSKSEAVAKALRSQIVR
jgi:DNA-binding NarL/FixJ family response regulator